MLSKLFWMLKSLLSHLWSTFLPTLGEMPAPIIAIMTNLPQPPDVHATDNARRQHKQTRHTSTKAPPRHLCFCGGFAMICLFSSLPAGWRCWEEEAGGGQGHEKSRKHSRHGEDGEVVKSVGIEQTRHSTILRHLHTSMYTILWKEVGNRRSGALESIIDLFPAGVDTYCTYRVLLWE
jgi:hypothetical protein